MLLNERVHAANLRARGFTLIELMIAMTLGILISLGLVMLFQATAKTSNVQNAMAQLQETGRYAITRIDNDLRMASFQSVNMSGFVGDAPNATSSPNGVNNPTISAMSHVATILLPDFDSAGLAAPSIADGWSGDWPTASAWPVSQRYNFQGYECSSGTCSPTLPTGTNALPAAGTAAGNRVATGDVFTVRYLSALGWSKNRNEVTFACSGGAGGTLTSITVVPATGSPALNFAATGDLALLVGTSSADIFQVNVSGSVLSPTAVLGGSLPCPAAPGSVSGGEMTLYNFSRDFHTITYYLRLDTDQNDANRLIPSLVRRDSTIANQGAASNDQVLVQGVEQMDFLNGVRRDAGTISYLTSDLVAAQSSSTNCPPMAQNQISAGLAAGSVEPGCLWRSLNSIEVHLLVDSVNNLYTLTPQDMAYRYAYAYSGSDNTHKPAPPPSLATSDLPSGLKAGKMLRREFVSLVSARNFNP